MRKLFLTALLVVGLGPAALAQTDDYSKFEFFGGYSHNRVDTGIDDSDPDLGDIFDEREGFNGFNASVVGNVSRYVGLKFDYSYHQKTFDFGPDNTNFRLHNFTGGLQFKDNTRDPGKKVKPFAHVLVGGARASVDLSEFDDTLADESDTGFAANIGGGVDFRINDRLDFRAIQVDWNPTRFSFNSTDINGNPIRQSQTAHNFRFGIGIVIR